MTTEEAIRNRKTIKLKADVQNPLSPNTSKAFKKKVEELIQLAGNAPFHYESNESHRKEEKLKGSEPWRFHSLDSETCRKLLSFLNEDKPVKSSEGIKQMLAAADALILVTWIPERTQKRKKNFYPNVKNMEHIAATAASIQSLLLAATEEGITNYWSSGGCLRRDKIFNLLGIPVEEILLGAVFLFPEPDPEKAEIIHGKNREKKSDLSEWMEWVNLK